jgi:hypothetical protein
MSKAWTDKTEYSKFSDELAKSQDREFESRILPLVRVVWPRAEIAPAMGWIDRAGIDIIVLSDNQPYPLIVQCKGFKVPEEDIGNSQIKQCLKSITSFRNSGIEAGTYLLIHNRTGKNVQLRTIIGEEIKKLVDSGQVKRGELWDRQRLLREVFNATLQLVRYAIEQQRTNAESYYGDRQICDPIKQVPFELSDLIFDPNHLMRQSNALLLEADPADELLKSDGSNLLLMIGEAGYGKTTAVLRTFASTNHLVFYLPAAIIPKHVNNTSTLLRYCVKVEELFDNVPNSDPEIFTRLFNTVVTYIFKDGKLPVVLLLDGLDESVYFNRRGGLQSLFNQLRDIQAPVVLTARKEFWLQRQLDFTDLFGKTGPQGKRQHRTIKLIELLPWKTDQIGNLAKRYRSTLKSIEQQAHLDKLIEIIDSEQYEDWYGDIPRRPLFLNFILETVAEHGVHSTGRARLYYEWAEAKVRRDICRPMIWGTLGRSPITSQFESLDATLRLAFLAMMLAAYRMTESRDNMIELLPSCPLDEFLLSDERLKGIADPTGLFLNSLLVPVFSRLLHEAPRLRFAHRAYQEFFLALFLRNHPEEFKGCVLPDIIVEYMNDLENEKL